MHSDPNTRREYYIDLFKFNDIIIASVNERFNCYLLIKIADELIVFFLKSNVTFDEFKWNSVDCGNQKNSL